MCPRIKSVVIVGSVARNCVQCSIVCRNVSSVQTGVSNCIAN